jgi:hypothetical protein
MSIQSDLPYLDQLDQILGDLFAARSEAVGSEEIMLRCAAHLVASTRDAFLDRLFGPGDQS